MFAKLIILFPLLALGALSAQYPDGLHPAVCPNYPFCDMDVLQRFTPSGMPIPEWVSNPRLLPVAPTENDAVAAAPRYPADVNPAICPDYPYCDAETMARYTPSGIPRPMWELNPALLPLAAAENDAVAAAPRYPADVNPAICPDYPYCDAETMARYTPSGIPRPMWELNPALLPLAATDFNNVATGSRYPVGLNPAVCPNYPYCDTGVLARYTPSGNPISPWVSNPALVPDASTESASEDITHKYPAGLHPAVCPNYPYCDADVLARYTPSGIPIPQWESNLYLRPVAATESTSEDTAPKYPAGLDPSLCANYPYCDPDILARYTSSGIPLHELNPSILPTDTTDDCSSETDDASK